MSTLEPGWTASRIPSQRGRRFVVTGANAGIGYETALELARAGGHVALTSRDAGRGEQALAALREAVPGADVTLELLDLASLASVRAFVRRLVAAGQPLDVLVNNAGVMSLPVRETTIDGFERQFGTNHLGHFALTAGLWPLLCKAPAPRVVTVSSGLASFARFDFDNLQSEKKYSPQGAYEVSKLANLYFAFELQRRAPAHLRSVAAHPGIAKTDLPKSGPRWFHRTFSQPASQGALSQLYAAVGDAAEGGDYIGPKNWFHLSGPPVKVKAPKAAADLAAAQRLWAHSEALTGFTFDVRA